jgi:hypothetical protein
MGFALSESQGLATFRCNLITKPEKVLAYCINPPDALLFRGASLAQFSTLLRRSVTFRL